MPVSTGDPFPSPFGFIPSRDTEEYAKCYLCDEVKSVKILAAIPVGYFRLSVPIAPTWTSGNEIKARALIGPMVPRSFRPPQLNGVPYICQTCWMLCQQTDAVVHEPHAEFGSLWNDPPMQFPPG